MEYLTQHNNIRSTSFDIVINDMRYHVAALSKKLASADMFVCDVRGLGLFVLYSRPDPLTSKNCWESHAEDENNMVVPLLEKCIDHYFYMS